MPSNPHHNPEIEQRLLATLFFGPDEVNAAVRDGLCAEAFEDPRNRAIFCAIAACAAEDRATDIITVWRRISGMTGDMAKVAVHELAGIEGMEPTSMRRARFVVDVIGLWRQRKLVQALANASEAAKATADNWTGVWEATEPHLRAAQQAGQETTERTVADMAAVAADRFLNGDKRPVVHTGLNGWDREAGPLRAGELVVIAARPGAGKTAIALNMAAHNARNGKGASAFFSLEMAGEELVGRLASTAAGHAGIHNHKLRADAALDVGKLKNLQIFDGSAAHSIAQIEARARLLACSPNGLRAIFIDYLQLIAPPADVRRENRERQVAEMSRRFKLLAGDLSCPVVLLAQLNRESEKEQRRPRLSDLRESGAIEQDADGVWFLYQPPDKNSVADESASEIKVSLYQAKRRNGKPGIEATLNFNRPIFQFTAA